jgi:hypothetical protein
MASIGMPQRRFQRDRDSGCLNISNLHGVPPTHLPETARQKQALILAMICSPRVFALTFPKDLNLV